jgi:hypothetical protein
MNRIRKFERALVAGDWHDHAKSTKYFGDIAVGIGLVIGAGAAAGAAVYSTNKQAGIANRGLSIAEDQQYKEDISFNQLQDLISNPAAFFSTPAYTASFGQGTQATSRANAAQFGPNSGNEASALQQFGQTFGQQQLLTQEQFLGGMSGSGFNPSGALGTASSATNSAAGGLSSLAGLLSFFGSSGMAGGSSNYNFNNNVDSGAPTQAVSPSDIADF